MGAHGADDQGEHNRAHHDDGRIRDRLVRRVLHQHGQAQIQEIERVEPADDTGERAERRQNPSTAAIHAGV